MAIVVGIDGSQESKNALHWAVQQGKKQNSAVHAVAVWHHPVQFGFQRMFPDDELQEQAQKAVDEAVSEATKDVSGCEVETRIQRGHTPSVLLAASRTAEMLVLGYRGRGSVSGVMLGSVVLHCVQHASCPVVVIR